MASKIMKPASPSSVRLAAILLNGSGDALMTRRLVAFALWLVNASVAAITADNTGERVMLAPSSAAKTYARAAAPAGRTAVCSRVPHGVENGNLVDHELDGVHRHRGSDDEIVLHRPGCIDDFHAAGDSEHGRYEIHVEPRRPSAADKAAQLDHPVRIRGRRAISGPENVPIR